MCAFKKDGSLSDFVPKEKRDYCLKELVETEAKYLEVLNMLKKHFIKVLTSLKDNEKKVIFMNIPQLADLHQDFYAKLYDYISKYIDSDLKTTAAAANRPKLPLLGSIFLEFKRQFLKYSSYCCDLPKGEILNSSRKVNTLQNSF